MPLPFDPDALAKTTDTFQVGMICRRDTGEIIEVEQWIPRQRLGEIHSLRAEQRRERATPLFTCFCCGHPALLKQHPNGGHFFAHRSKSDAEKDNCRYQEGRGIPLEELNRLRYQGQREGARHRRTKDLICRIIAADPRFASPEKEQVWRTFEDGWRKPDVASVWDGMQVVFEAQVSNTYPQVVAERTDFYAKQGALLIWIFDLFPDAHWRTLHADTFCANEQHLFVVDEECASHSETTGYAHFRLYTLRPEVEARKREDDGKYVLHAIQKESFELCRFDALALDPICQTAILFNADTEKRRADHKILCAIAQSDFSYNALEQDIRQLIGRTSPIPHRNVEGWAALICAIEARRLNAPVGTKYANAAGLLNLVYDHHPSYFAHLVWTLDRLGLDPADARRGAWKKWVDDFRNDRYKEGPLPNPHVGSDKLLRWLYP